MEADRKRSRKTESRDDKRRRTAGCETSVEHGVGGDKAAAAEDVDDEVEQFFAIVQRMHLASRQYSSGGAAAAGHRGGVVPVNSRQAEEDGKGRFHRWRPAFEWEDFQHDNLAGATGAGDGGKRSEVETAASSPAATVGVAGKMPEEQAAKAAEDRIAVRLDLNEEPEPEPVLG